MSEEKDGEIQILGDTNKELLSQFKVRMTRMTL